MKMKELESIIDSLTKSQGSYGRFKNALDVGDNWAHLLNAVNKEGITDAVGLVMFLEG